MNCNIINASHASLNGSCSAYGGNISSATFNPSLLNGQHRATVTLIGDSLDSPAQGDDIDLSIGSLVLPMTIGSYTISNSAGSISRLTINLYDKSHEFLDNSFVLLKEEVPDSLKSDTIGILGRKKGPRPDIGALQGLGLITPASDTVFIDVRDFYSGFNRFFVDGGSDTDTLVQQAAGKTNWFWSSDKDGGDTLSDIFGNLIEGEVPNGPYSFHGRLRDVIVQICDMVGLTAYWDMTKEKVVISKTFLNQSSLDTTSCTVLSTTSTQDFTVTRANGAAGSFTSSFPGNNQSDSGGKMSRYFNALLVDPTLHYKKTCASTELVKLEFDSISVQKALSASLNPSVYAMYVLQSVLSSQPNSLPSETFERSLSGRDNSADKQTFSLEESEKINGQYAGNNFLAEYYLNSTNDGCTAENVFALKVGGDESDEKDFKKVFGNAAQTWNKNKGALPYSKMGEWSKEGGTFDLGNVLLYKQGQFSSILDDNANLLGEGDLLRNYLQAILAIKGNLYVVKDNSGRRTVKGGGRNYGYYVTSSSGGMGARPEAPDGYTLMQVNPFKSLADVGDPYKTWATVLYSMYTTSDGCVDDFLANTQVVEFIYALDQASPFFQQVDGGGSKDTNSLKSLFQKSGSATADKESTEGDQEFTMYLIMRDNIFNPISAFDSQKRKCFSSEIFDVDIPGVLKNMVNGICQLNFKSSTLNKMGAKGVESSASSSSSESSENYMFAAVTTADVGEFIEPTIVSTKSPRSIKMWYDVDGASSDINSGPSEIFLSDARPPPSNENTWKSSMSLGISVNSADIADGLGINQTYLADTADETFKYSRQNIPFMKKNLKEKIKDNTSVENDIAVSESVTYLLAEDEFPEIPGFGEGLDSLDIRSNNGKTELTVTAGNATILRSKAALKDLKAVNSHLLNQTVNLIPNPMNFAPNARIQNFANGNL